MTSAYADLVIQSGESFSLAEDEVLVIDGDLTIESGATFTGANNAQIRVSGNWINDGSFNSNTVAVYFVGIGTSSTISGNTRFYDFIVDHNEDDTDFKTLIFASGSTQTVTNNVLLNGQTVNSEVVLRSSAPGNQYNAFDLSTAVSVSSTFVDVQDAVAINGDILSTNSIDSGNTVRWLYPIAPIMLKPFDGEQNVASVNTVSFEFPYDVNGIANKYIVVKNSNGVVVGTVAANDSSKVVINGGLVTVTTAVVAVTNMTYTVEVDEGAFHKTGFSPLSILFNWSFTTGEIPGSTIKILDDATPLDDYTVALLDRPDDGSSTYRLIAQVDPAQSELGYSVVFRSDTMVGANIQGVVTHSLDVHGNDGRVEHYIDVDGDSNGVPDIMWDVDRGTIEKVNMVFTTLIDDATTSTIDLADRIGLPLGHENAVVSYTSRPHVSGEVFDANHRFTLWGLSGGEYQPVTREITSSGVWEVTAEDYILALDMGSNLLVARGSISLPLPLDIPSSVRLVKSANRKEASVGSIITYTITAENVSGGAFSAVNIIDDIPPGFKYLEGSAQVVGEAVRPDGIGGGVLKFSLGSLLSGVGDVKTLYYQLVVGSGVNQGKYVNTAVAVNAVGGTSLSLPDTAEVDIVPDVLFDMSTIIGKVFDDRNGNGYQDNGENPVPYAHIITADGRRIITDSNGQYHMANVVPGRHLLRLDQRYLPEHTRLTSRRSVVVNVSQGIAAKVNFAVQLPQTESTNRRSMRVDVLSEDIAPRLNVQHFGDAMLTATKEGFVRSVEFRLSSNYPAYISSWRLDIVDSLTRRSIKTYHGTADDFYQPIHWQGDTKTGKLLAQNYRYRLTVTDENNRSNTTTSELLAVQAHTGDYRAPTARERARSYSDWLDLLAVRDITKAHTMRISGQSVRISGAKLHHLRVDLGGNQALMIPVHEMNQIDASQLLTDKSALRNSQVNSIELILPRRYSRIDGLSLSGDTTLAVSEGSSAHTTVDERYELLDSQELNPDSDLFIVGMFDGEMGLRDVSGDKALATSGDSRYKEGEWYAGKASVYMDGTIAGKYHIEGMFDSERDKEDLFRQLDENDSYATFGDGSSEEDLGSLAAGKLYLQLDWEGSRARWGQYNTGLNDTDLMRFNRKLEGGYLAYQRVETTSFGDAKTTLTAFTAKARQKAAHNELLSTGSTVYYLRHRNALSDSMRLRLEVRDRISGNILETITLIPEHDYELNASSGRIIFWQPIERFVKSGLLINATAEAGNPVYVVADYNYTVIDNISKGVLGGRITQAVTDGVTVGLTYIDEAQDSTDYNLQGIDTTLNFNQDNRLTFEYAESESRAMSYAVSTDGGLHWGIVESVDGVTGDEVGRAWSVKGEHSLRDNTLELQYYYRNIDSTFSSVGTESQRGTEAIGFDATLALSDFTTLRLKNDSQRRIDEGSAQANHQAGAKKTSSTIAQFSHTADRFVTVAEYRHDYTQDLNVTNITRVSGASDSVALEVRYQLSDTSEVRVAQQASIGGDENSHQTTVGIITQFNPELDVDAAATVGNRGESVSVGLGYSVSTIRLNANVSADTMGYRTGLGGSYSPDEDHSYSAFIEQSKDLDGEDRTSMVLGSRRKLSDDLTLETNTSRTLSGDSNLQNQQTVLTKTLDEERTAHIGLSRYQENEKEAATNGFDMTLGADLSKQWAMDFSFGKGYVHRLDGALDRRDNLNLGIAYIHLDDQDQTLFKSSFRADGRRDSGVSNVSHHLIAFDLQGKLNIDWSVVTGLDWGRSKDRDSGVDQARNNRYDLGFAYRPVYNDTVNFIFNYSWTDERAPSSQIGLDGTAGSFNGLRAQVLANDIIWDVTPQWQLTTKLAYRWGKEQVYSLPWAETETWLLATKVGYHFNPDTLLSLELRHLEQRQAQDSKDGAVIELSKRFDALEAAIGYDWSEFDDDLGAMDYETKGPYFRFTGVLDY